MNTGNQILFTGVIYCLFFLLCFWIYRKKSENVISEKVLNGNWILLHARHAGGILLMIFLPLVFLPAIPTELLTWPEYLDSIWILSLLTSGILLSTLSLNEARQKVKRNQIRGTWSPFHTLIHIVLRSFFLAGYEWFFRGILLFSCIAAFGEVTAVVINTVAYAWIHSFNGKKEFLGSIPFGILLCVLTIWWQSVWPAIFLHLVLSSTYESVMLNTIFSKRSKIII